jgi:hypothetical protein
MRRELTSYESGIIAEAALSKYTSGDLDSYLELIRDNKRDLAIVDAFIEAIDNVADHMVDYVAHLVVQPKFTKKIS